jgi:hypothetical protein
LCVGPLYSFVADKTSKTFRADGGLKSFEFGARTLGDHFNAAIGQVADKADDLEAGGDGLGGVTKTDALDAA